MTGRRPLDLEVLHHGRRVDKVQSEMDPDDHAALSKRLQGWLTANKWDKGRWAEFEILARDAGRSRQLAKVGP